MNKEQMNRDRRRNHCKRITFDLHDDFGSELTGLKFTLRELADKDPENEDLGKTTAIVERLLGRLREISLSIAAYGVGLASMDSTYNAYTKGGLGRKCN
jgi:hypothetical protein